MKKATFLLWLALGSLLTACTQAPATQISTTAESTVAEVSSPTSSPEPTAAPVQITSPVDFLWSMSGDPNPFKIPVGVAVDQDGNLYVMDSGNSQVQKFDEKGKALTTMILGAKAGEKFDKKGNNTDYWTVGVYSGDSKTMTFRAPSEPGKYVVQCGLPGHYQAGMVATMYVNNALRPLRNDA